MGELAKFWDRTPRRMELSQGDAFETPEGKPEFRISHQLVWPAQDEPRPFDREHCIALYLDALRAQTSIYRPLGAVNKVLGDVKGILGVLSQEEARFWLRVFGKVGREELLESIQMRQGQGVDVDRDTSTFEGYVRARLVALDVSSPMDSKEVCDNIEHLLYEGDREGFNRMCYASYFITTLAQCIRAEFGVVEGLRVICEAFNMREYGRMFQAFGSTEGHEQQVCEMLRDFVQVDDTLGNTLNHYIWAEVLDRCPDRELLGIARERIAQRRHQVGHILQRLPMLHEHPDDIIADYKYYRVPMGPRQVLDFYARFGEESLDDLLALISNRAHKARRPELAQALWPVANEKLAGWMLALAQDEKTREAARHWLHGEGVHATLGLMRIVKSRGKRRNQAITELREIARIGHVEEIRGLLPHVKSATARELIQKEVLDFEHEEVELAVADELPGWATEILAFDWIESEEVEKNTTFFALDDAPAVLLDDGSGHALPTDVLARLVVLGERIFPRDKRRGKAGPERDAREARQVMCREMLARVRVGVEGETLGCWLWHLLEMWWSKKMEFEHGACVALIGYCASDVEVTSLFPKFRSASKWFGSYDVKRHAREAITGLGVVGTVTSWMLLDELAKHARSQWMLDHARKVTRQLRAEHELSEQMWQDRIVSNAGLDERGTRVFDYGPRRFELRFRGAFDVEFVDEQGKHFTRLPPARKSDDVDCVKGARADYKAVKAQLEQVIRSQTVRLERAMAQMQSWSEQDWWEFVAGHPLLRHFARKLVWVKKTRGEADVYFRCTEDGATLDVDYEEVAWSGGACVMLMHPAELDMEALQQWVEVFADYEIVQPFEQLEREVYAPAHHVLDDLVELLRTRRSWRWNLARMDRYGEETYWQMKQESYEVVAIWHDYGPWRLMVACDEAAWTGKARKRHGKGVYVLRLEESEIGSVVPLSEVPGRVYSEAFRESRRFFTT